MTKRSCAVLRHCRVLGTLVLLGATVAGSLSAIASPSTPDRTGWPSSIKIGTASQGGTFFIYGAGMGGFIQERLGVNATAEVTGGPTQNLALVHAGDLQLGLTTMGPGNAAWEGNSEIAPGTKMRNVRALFPMYMTPFQVVALKRSGIASVQDLNGKRVGVGPRGGTASIYWPEVFKQLGLKVNVQFGGASDQVGQVQDGLIDAFAFAAGVPISAFSQIEAQQPVNIFALTPEALKSVLAKNPALSEFVIPPGTYRSVTEPQPTFAMWNFAIAHKDLPESFVYEVMKLVLDNNERMVQIHKSASESLPENMVHNSFMWFHPGAVRYYKEKGMEVPAHLIPPEYKG